MRYGSPEFNQAVFESRTRIAEDLRIGFPPNWIDVEENMLDSWIEAVKKNDHTYVQTGDLMLTDRELSALKKKWRHESPEEHFKSWIRNNHKRLVLA